MQEIKIAIPRPISKAISNTGIAQNIFQEYSRPSTVRMMKKINKVGINLNSAMTVAEIGSITRGKAVFKIKR